MTSTLCTRANLDWLADPAPGGYPGWRGSTRRSVRYTGRTSLTVAMSCRRVERHTGFYWSPSIRLMGTDPEWRGYIRSLASTAGDRNWYTGQPSSLKAMLCIFQSVSVFTFFVCTLPFWNNSQFGAPALYRLTRSNMPWNMARQDRRI